MCETKGDDENGNPVEKGSVDELTAAVIEIKEGMSRTEDEINEFCVLLPKYKRPKKIIFASVPRNPTGKTEKPRLKEMYCSGSIVEVQIKN